MKKQNTKKGFTIAEVLIAISIFVIVATISTSILIRTVNMEKLTDIRNTMLDDARVFMEQLTSIINNGAIDYEEYYNINVIQGVLDPDAEPTDPIAYGVYYGAYGSRFYSGGHAAYREEVMVVPTENPDNLGIDCADPLNAPPQYCETTYTESKDENEGQNPYDASNSADQGDANAFCDKSWKGGTAICLNDEAVDTFSADELYIISDVMRGDGTVQKYIIATQPLEAAVEGEEDEVDKIAVAAIMNGLDVDGNNTIDLFRCEDEGSPCNEASDRNGDIGGFYDNYPLDFIPEVFDPDEGEPGDEYIYSLPLKSDHTEPFKVGQPSFFPFTPFRTSIKNLTFIISPVDDPYKAYNENNMKMHPTVTILLTVRPYKADRARYPGGWKDDYDVTIQRTVTAGITEIESFPPTFDLTWICKTLGSVSGVLGCAEYEY